MHLATRSLKELTDLRRLGQQLFSGQSISDLADSQSDAHVCEIEHEDGEAQIIGGLNLERFHSRQQRSNVGQNDRWFLERTIRFGSPFIRSRKP